jgi:hypothetical protein
MRKKQLAWWLWAAGTALIVLSWFSVVTPQVGWGGFAISVCGSMLSWGLRPPRSPKPLVDTNNDQAPKI